MPAAIGTPARHAGKLGGYLSKQYTSYRRRIGLDAPGKDGHALRHVRRIARGESPRYVAGRDVEAQ